MELHVVNTGFFKLDGGAMFGVVPKALWNQTNPADQNNLCNWAMRCMIAVEGDRIVLIDNGIGDKQDAKFFSHYFLHGNDSLSKSLNKIGIGKHQITDNFLTHLHFDHCGGGISYGSHGQYELTFPRATYWTNEAHWKWATLPNEREKASFLKENILPMEEIGNLKSVDMKKKTLFQGFDFITVDGHTDKQMLPKIQYKGQRLVFVADLLPSVTHIPIPYVMGYDTRPLLTMTEKAIFLEQAARENWILFFEHDPVNECCTVKMTEKGVRVDQIFNLNEI